MNMFKNIGFDFQFYQGTPYETFLVGVHHFEGETSCCGEKVGILEIGIGICKVVISFWPNESSH